VAGAGIPPDYQAEMAAHAGLEPFESAQRAHDVPKRENAEARLRLSRLLATLYRWLKTTHSAAHLCVISG
jgi:hypothetical protein